MSTFAEEKSIEIFKPYLVEGAKFTDKYEFPILKKVEFKPTKAIPFDKSGTATDFEQWVHFYTDDYRFDCFWNNPRRYLERFKKFAGIITPDYSLYRILPLSFQIWNTYRNRALAYWLQRNDINIVPNIRWGDERTYDFAFAGIEKGGSVAISTSGCISEKEDREYFKKGLAKMVKVLQPETIINYSNTPDDIFAKYKKQGIEIITLENWTRIAKGAKS